MNFKLSICVSSLAQTRTCQARLFLRYQHSKFQHLQSYSYQPQRMCFITRNMFITLVCRFIFPSLIYRHFYIFALPKLAFWTLFRAKHNYFVLGSPLPSNELPLSYFDATDSLLQLIRCLYDYSFARCASFALSTFPYLFVKANFSEHH